MRNRTTLAFAVVAIGIAGGASTLAQRAGAKRADGTRIWRGSELPRPRLAQAPPRAKAPANTLPPSDPFANQPLPAGVINFIPESPFLPVATQPPLPAAIPVTEPTPVEAPQAPAADPMADVEAFVVRSRHEADRSIAALSREADELKDRLKRVETALARWRQVAGALDNEPTETNALEPILEPVPEPIPIEANPEPVPDNPSEPSLIGRPSIPK